MRHSAAFFKSILDSVTDHIVIIDQNGIIRFVNAAWSNFAIANQCAVLNPHEWRGINYLDVLPECLIAGISLIFSARNGAEGRG